MDRLLPAQDQPVAWGNATRMGQVISTDFRQLWITSKRINDSEFLLAAGAPTPSYAWK
ncbi:hypothetical protein RSAG8_13442, partial [Rhizoctonia solani AG-8 WAC10335]